MKVKYLANELGKRPKDFIKMLHELEIHVKSENTKLEDDVVATIKELLKPSKAEKEAEEANKIVQLSTQQLTLSELSVVLKCSLKDVMSVVMSKGLLLNLNSTIDADFAVDIAHDLGIKVNQTNTQSEDNKTTIKEPELATSSAPLKYRAPIVTVMGHVDHGKTSLLDSIRNKNVVDTESGGITQHIGAYQVRLKSKKKITFLDTPGHEAFTALRARGAKVTDIVVLVVAANDGLKPQTIEAINHCKAAKTPIIVAVNKIDLPGANIEAVKQQLVEYELVPEEWGGDTVICPLSAKTAEGIDQLLEIISITSEVLELKTTYDDTANGTIIEAYLDKKRGPICTVLLISGTLNQNDHLAIGSTYGKARAMFNENNEPIKKGLPSMPVEILGLSAVPKPGDTLRSYATEAAAKTVISEINEKAAPINQKIVKNIGLDTLTQQISDDRVKKLNLIVKSDVHGSLDAIIYSIQKIESTNISIDILHSGTGSITENDVLLAKASDALLFGFRVTATNDAKKMIESNNLTFKTYDIIYEILDDIHQVMSGMTISVQEDVLIGTAEVREIFNFSKIGTIAGAYVQSGHLIRNNSAKVIREEKLIFEGQLTSLKRFKDDVKRVESGYECGIVIDKAPEFKAGDVIECYGIEK